MKNVVSLFRVFDLESRKPNAIEYSATAEAPHQSRVGSEIPSVLRTGAYACLPWGPIHCPCDPDATYRGAPHGVTKAIYIVSVCCEDSYELNIDGQNATFVSLFQVEITVSSPSI